MIIVYIVALFVTYFLYNLTIPLYSRSGQLLGALGASTLYLFSGTITMFVVLLVSEKNFTAGLLHAPWYLYVNGLVNILVLAAILVLLPKVGMGVVWSTGTVGQFIASLLLDHYDFSGTGAIPITSLRLIAVTVIVIGSIIFTILGQKPTKAEAKRMTIPMWLSILIGTVVGILQSTMNGVNTLGGLQLGSNRAVFLYLGIGTILAMVGCLLFQPSTLTKMVRTKPQYYIPGVVNVLIVGLPVVMVPLVGIGLYTGVFFLASSASSILFDSFGLMGMPKIKMNTARILGASAMLIGVLMLT